MYQSHDDIPDFFQSKGDVLHVNTIGQLISYEPEARDGYLVIDGAWVETDEDNNEISHAGFYVKPSTWEYSLN